MARDDMDVRPRRSRGGLEFGGPGPRQGGPMGDRGDRPFRGRGGMRVNDDNFRGGFAERGGRGGRDGRAP